MSTRWKYAARMLRVNVIASGCLIPTTCMNLMSLTDFIVTYPDVASKSGMAIFERCIMITGVCFLATILHSMSVNATWSIMNVPIHIFSFHRIPLLCGCDTSKLCILMKRATHLALDNLYHCYCFVDCRSFTNNDYIRLGLHEDMNNQGSITFLCGSFTFNLDNPAST